MNKQPGSSSTSAAEQVLHTYRSAFDLPDGLSGVAGYTQTTSRWSV